MLFHYVNQINLRANNNLPSFRANGWDSSKNVQNGESMLPLNVNSGGSSSEKLDITSASLTGLASLTRSKSASFNADKVGRAIAHSLNFFHSQIFTY